MHLLGNRLFSVTAGQVGGVPQFSCQALSVRVARGGTQRRATAGGPLSNPQSTPVYVRMWFELEAAECVCVCVCVCVCACACVRCACVCVCVCVSQPLPFCRYSLRETSDRYLCARTLALWTAVLKCVWVGPC